MSNLVRDPERKSYGLHIAINADNSLGRYNVAFSHRWVFANPAFPQLYYKP